ncbi:7-cyano-7-deazaguanine synthase QueC [Planctomycetales bacterium 10988]|nr:7-cyano-7-deazaguanine synthase QueC [Planctomycetales bacterium 10988]
MNINSSSSHSKKALILLSGGLDSATTGAMAKHSGYQLYALSIDYGQRHRFELDSAKQVAQALNVIEHLVLKVDLSTIGGSALTADIEVPKERDSETMSAEIPVTYVPARNTVFLSIAVGYCEMIDCEDIFLGVNAIDYSGYPDCRPEYIEAFANMANLATKAAVEGRHHYKFHTPLITMTKAEIILKGTELGVDYGITHSCYDPDDQGIACGRCDACHLRMKGFEEAGIPDPTQYQS